MQIQKQILFRGETSALKTNPVESFPVKADKKLSIVVGDFSMIPTSAIELLCMIGNTQMYGKSVYIGTKSAKKGWRLIAKW